MDKNDPRMIPGISAMSKAELRKSNKPIMEKKRRARINRCLDELKKILLETVKKDSAQHSKLEKADILEMTVKHLRQIQRRQLVLSVSLDRSVLEKFRTGFSDCATEVRRFIAQIEDIPDAAKQQLYDFLESSVQRVQQTTPQNFATLMEQQRASSSFGDSSFTDDLNNNQRMQVDLVPARLPTGELAFVMPAGTNFSALGQKVVATRALLQQTSTPRFSAFNVVPHAQGGSYSTSPASPPLSPISGDEPSEKFRPSTSTPPFFPARPSFATPLGRLEGSSRSDSGISVSELLFKPTVPVHSYTELLKSRPLASSSSSSGSEGSPASSADLSLSRSLNGSGNSSAVSEVKEEKTGDMWRPW